MRSFKNTKFTQKLSGKMFGDKGYISAQLNQILFANSIHSFTTINKNMTNSLMTIADRILLRKRSVTETINDELKIFIR